MNTKRQDDIDIAQPKELDPDCSLYEFERRERVTKEGVNAAPMLTVAWAILVAHGIPDDQALHDVIYSHEEILNKFINSTGLLQTHRIPVCSFSKSPL